MQKLLRQVSRSFYLTLQVLPHSIKPQLSIAYLLARAADTIADTGLVQVKKRMEALLQLRRCISDTAEGRKVVLPEFGRLAEARNEGEGEGSPAERILLQNLAEVLEVLRGFSDRDRRRVHDVLMTITHGQELDLIRFGDASEKQIACIDTEEDLEEYIYCVAGCVGEFWTKMCRAYPLSGIPFDDEKMIHDGIRFGKGLQLVNILRDLPRDLQHGRCYIPREHLEKIGLTPQRLLDVSSMRTLHPLYLSYLNRAEEYLFDGWKYTTTMPMRFMRIRLACSWPILIGVRTLRQLRYSNVLTDHHRIKLSHVDMRRLILRSALLYPIAGLWRGLFEKVRQEPV
ncbi:MAG: phytoene/squalene synthase family protein [Acidobacteriota bacterium]